MRIQPIARAAHPDFLDLPWHAPLEKWRSARLVEAPRGIGRHVVRFGRCSRLGPPGRSPSGLRPTAGLQPAGALRAA